MSDKPFKTIEEQITILKSRKLIIEDESLAYDVLSGNNYYFLTGYKSLLLKNENSDEYKDNATFNDLYSLYKLDKEIKMLTLEVLLQIEQRIKTILAYELCYRYGDECRCYSDPQKFDLLNKNTVNMVRKVNQQIDVSKNKNKALKHYVDNHGGNIPFWVAIKVLTFGTVQKMYSSLKTNDKDYISRKFLFKDITNRRAKTVETFLELIVDERNVCAHDEMFMNFIHNKIKITETVFHKEFNLYKNNKGEVVAGRKDFFALLITIKHFVSKEKYCEYIDMLKQTLNKHMKNVTIYSEEELYKYIHLPLDFEKIKEL